MSLGGRLILESRDFVEAVGIPFILNQFNSSCSWLIEARVMSILKGCFDKVLTVFGLNLHTDNDDIHKRVLLSIPIAFRPGASSIPLCLTQDTKPVLMGQLAQSCFIVSMLP
jgi:hypothetical protein